MNRYGRDLLKVLLSALKKGKSVLLLGPRQTGKTTLVKAIPSAIYISFMDPAVRAQYEQNPARIIQEVEALRDSQKKRPLVVLDEVQKVPVIMDAVQILIDNQKAQFLITGSSARQIRNLLPGRVLRYQLDPLTLSEIPKQELSLEKILSYGTLPGIWKERDPQILEAELKSYLSLYLEEEIRKEALVRNLPAFSNFLRLACLDSGNPISFRGLSQEVGVSHSTIAEYYRILESCMVVERVEPLIQSRTRRRLMHSPKFLFFDLGIRRVCSIEGVPVNPQYLPLLFEQWIGLELRRFSRLSAVPYELKFWRDHAGPEVDWVLSGTDWQLPIEVKWTQNPSLKEAKHLTLFLKENKQAKKALIVCRCPRPMKLTDAIVAIPWQQLLLTLPRFFPTQTTP